MGKRPRFSHHSAQIFPVKSSTFHKETEDKTDQVPGAKRQSPRGATDTASNQTQDQRPRDLRSDQRSETLDGKYS